MFQIHNISYEYFRKVWFDLQFYLSRHNQIYNLHKYITQSS